MAWEFFDDPASSPPPSAGVIRDPARCRFRGPAVLPARVKRLVSTSLFFCPCPPRKRGCAASQHERFINHQAYSTCVGEPCPSGRFKPEKHCPPRACGYTARRNGCIVFVCLSSPRVRVHRPLA